MLQSASIEMDRDLSRTDMNTNVSKAKHTARALRAGPHEFVISVARHNLGKGGGRIGGGCIIVAFFTFVILCCVL